MEGDFRHYFQEDLLDLFRRRLSPRQAWILVNWLPAESATWTAVRDATPESDLALAHDPDKHGRWSRLEHLVARAGDLQQSQLWMFARANFEHVPGNPPEPLSRPGLGSNVIPIDDRALRHLQNLRKNHGAFTPANGPEMTEEDPDGG